LNSSDKEWADTASGGFFLVKLPQDAKEPIEHKASKVINLIQEGIQRPI